MQNVVPLIAAAVFLVAGTVAASKPEALLDDIVPLPATAPTTGKPFDVLNDPGFGPSCTPERRAIAKREKQVVQGLVDQLEAQRSRGLPDNVSPVIDAADSLKIRYVKFRDTYALLFSYADELHDPVSPLFTCTTMHRANAADVKRLGLYEPMPGGPSAGLYYSPTIGWYFPY